MEQRNLLKFSIDNYKTAIPIISGVIGFIWFVITTSISVNDFIVKTKTNNIRIDTLSARLHLLEARELKQDDYNYWFYNYKAPKGEWLK